MHAKIPGRFLSRAAGLAVIVILSGCANSTPIDPENVSRPDQIKAGPGLITGSEGEFSVEIKRPS
jgi:hypothetical protein